MMLMQVPVASNDPESHATPYLYDCGLKIYNSAIYDAVQIM